MLQLGIARSHLVVVELKTHAIMNLIIFERDVILVDCVPFLDPQLLGPRARLRCQQLFEVADRVVCVALDADLLAKTIVADDLDHAWAREELAMRHDRGGHHTKNGTRAHKWLWNYVRSIYSKVWPLP